MAGIYQTKQSREILEVLRAADGHMTAEQLCLALHEKGSRTGLATVYRHLNKLAETGIVRRFSNGTSSACYQFSQADGACHSHLHLKCNVCGGLFHVKCSELDRLSSHLFDEHSFSVDSSKTVLYGVCSACGASEGK